MTENMNPLLNMQTDAASSAATDAVHRTADGITPEEEKRRMRKAALIKMLAMIILIICCIIFGSIAWFAQNKKVDATGMQVMVSGGAFEISVLTGGSNGAYKSYQDLVHDPSALVWQMKGTDSNSLEQNFGNYPQAGTENDGIYPGCSGYISFIVTPKVDSVNLNFTFDLLSYDENVNLTPPLVQLDASADADVINYLNGHILLFESYNTSTHMYSGLIKNTTDLSRVLSNKTFTGKNTPTTVNIYWVWAENLSDLLNTETVTTTVHNDDTNEDETEEVTRSTFCGDEDFLDYIEANPHYFMRGVTASDHVTISDIKDNYEYFGGRYNFADNVIGSRVRFLLLTMSVSSS